MLGLTDSFGGGGSPGNLRRLRTLSFGREMRMFWICSACLLLVGGAFRLSYFDHSTPTPPPPPPPPVPVTPPPPPRVVRWDPVRTVTGRCCWNRARQSCSDHSECDPGGQGCVSPGTWTDAFGPAVCTPPPAEHLNFLAAGGAGSAVARQIAGDEKDARPAPATALDMTYLVVDIHGGALGDTLGFLRNDVGVPRENLFFICMWTPYCARMQMDWAAGGEAAATGVHRMAYDSGYHAAVSYSINASTMLPLLHIVNVTGASGFRWPLHDFVARAREWDSRRGPGAPPLVDVILCNVGAEACLALEPFAAHVVVRATHRFDHASCMSGDNWLQTGGPDRWLTGFQTGRMLQRLAKSPHHSVAAGQVYDAAYNYHFTGANTWVWPLSAPDATASYRPTEDLRSKVLLLPNWPFDPQNNWRAWLHELTHLMGEQGLDLNTPGGYWKGNFSQARVMQHRVAISIPYSVGSQLWFEMYRMGMPMFAPTVRLMAELHLRNGLVFHRCCELRAHCPTPCYEAEDFGQNRTSTWELPNLFEGGPPKTVQLPRYGDKTEEATRAWLGLLEQYQLPHIELFDSFPELIKRLTEVTDAELASRSEKQHRAAIELEKSTASEVRDRFSRLAAAGPASPSAARAPVEIPVGLPRCAYHPSGRVNFREYGQWLGT
eukprot:TRINITY_DN3004_c2_g1_i4.p1 TRINITY_DN3004_c2_g1~~TRINITY_DN3004_c2_g1_i4.p1  ORF type:complete len:674 (+),score=180.54 TRINITY_DN3004_c2_g1_i4:40-2022(+)